MDSPFQCAKCGITVFSSNRAAKYCSSCEPLSPKRFSDAYHIIQGAVNPVAVARSLNEAIQEVWKETNDMDIVRKDPAVRQIAYQLAHILRLASYEAPTAHADSGHSFHHDYNLVKEKANVKAD